MTKRSFLPYADVESALVSDLRSGAKGARATAVAYGRVALFRLGIGANLYQKKTGGPYVAPILDMFEAPSSTVWDKLVASWPKNLRESALLAEGERALRKAGAVFRKAGDYARYGDLLREAAGVLVPDDAEDKRTPRKYFPLAEKHLKKAMAIDARWKADCLDSLAQLALGHGDIEEAEAYFRKELALYKDRSEARGDKLSHIGTVFVRHGYPIPGERYYLRGIDLYEERGKRAELELVYDLAAHYYEVFLNDEKKSRYYRERARALAGRP